MKIGNNFENLSQVQSSQGNSQGSAASTAAHSSTAAVPGDTAHLSTLSGQIKQAVLATNASDVRLDKVAAIQSAIAAGTYSVPASQVASKLVDSMLNGKS